ncbi:GNAT family N-acetyltransferase [Allonocardiopsis opalescens]|uniref:Ribosomal protein S18 acetylase RimI-like enzyme n=1 Tax=Allonocardiopsis opalescens TaxID=1144618 RepID=A0A2T0Q5M5_9ACTN|nr:GNAT family N-acetyltransferase [Allonocardiopsis opalescens]PRX99070.1 ribosomal protein S18 acetylase RimI-like enzyme [Allonocardiopsis opalescens]
MSDTSTATIRPAVEDDVPAIVALLADDALGATRETPGDLAPYRAAFRAMAASPDQLLVVAEAAGRVVGTLQLTVIAGLSLTATTRAQIEAVRVHADMRGTGLGARLVRWAIDEAARRGCGLVQLTSNASRADAHRFYQRLGFAPTHVGFKLRIDRG